MGRVWSSKSACTPERGGGGGSKGWRGLIIKNLTWFGAWLCGLGLSLPLFGCDELSVALANLELRDSPTSATTQVPGASVCHHVVHDHGLRLGFAM